MEISDKTSRWKELRVEADGPGETPSRHRRLQNRNQTPSLITELSPSACCAEGEALARDARLMQILLRTMGDGMATRVVRATVENDVAERLERLAADAGCTKSYLVNRALKEYFLELDDLEIALKRRGGASTPIERVIREQGL